MPRFYCILLGALICGMTTQGLVAAVVSFAVDPAIIDNDPADGVITGNEFSPTGSDGTVFTMTPMSNLVGGSRFLLDSNTGLQFGGGGGSTLSFDFSADRNVEVHSYTLSGTGFFFGDPVFDIREGATVLSEGNTAVSNGETHNFVDGPIPMQAGVTYQFIATTTGAGIQSFMGSWEYSVLSQVPEPTTLLLGFGTCAWFGFQRKIVHRAG